MLSAEIVTEEMFYIDAIPTYEKNIIGCDPLPEGYDFYIVSALYATAHGQTEAGNIYVVADPVMSDDGATFRGCRGLAKF